MLKQFVLFSIFFSFIAACALTEQENQPVAEANRVSASSVSEIQPSEQKPTVAEAKEESKAAADPAKLVSSDTIRRIQAHLKSAGFYQGPVDGADSSMTRRAVERFQTSCNNLKDLISAPRPGIKTPAKAVAARDKSRTADARDVRIIQLRLKDAGFDPGPIDGVNGARTQGALSALQSGCAMLQEVPPPAVASLPRSARATEQHVFSPAGNAGPNSGREAIRALQLQLRNSGYDPGPIDGVLGQKTRLALEKQQAQQAMSSSTGM